jgi:hypothetical protein
MSFMYLDLRVNKEGKIRARVRPNGELKARSIGTANARMTDSPFAVFQIEEFEGLEVISDQDLLDELLSRHGHEGLCRILALRLSPQELLKRLAGYFPGEAVE